MPDDILPPSASIRPVAKQNVAETIFGSDRSADPIVIADGEGIKLGIERGNLLIVHAYLNGPVHQIVLPPELARQFQRALNQLLS